MSYDLLVWLRDPPNPEQVGAFLAEQGYVQDRDPWWKDLDENDVLTMRPISEPDRGPVFHCFFGPVSDPISRQYTALAMFCVGGLWFDEHIRPARSLARKVAGEFRGRVRDPQVGEWLS